MTTVAGASPESAAEATTVGGAAPGTEPASRVEGAVEYPTGAAGIAPDATRTPAPPARDEGSAAAEGSA
ncbi:hypothetical protein, partial [uncultured Cellulomonas sp.]|uniref:hypothetical protein n=1 Tax=uncultured Cellulomonas sp. TaxID=189682 RepID=UPI0028F1445B